MSDKGPQALNVSKDPGAPGSDGSAPVIGQAASPSPAPPHPPPPTWTEIPVRLGAYQQPAPVPGIPLAPPLVTPQTGQVVVAWEVFKPNPGCCQCNGLSTAGWVSIVLLIIFFTPLAWSKFLYTSCHYTRLLYWQLKQHCRITLMHCIHFSSAVPCVIQDCFTDLQRPVYGWPQAPNPANQPEGDVQNRDASFGQSMQTSPDIAVQVWIMFLHSTDTHQSGKDVHMAKKRYI